MACLLKPIKPLIEKSFMSDANSTYGCQLAQFNVAKFLTSKEDPSVADFVNNLDRINALAEQSEGFIWRLKDDGSDDELAANPYGENTVANMSVWRDVESLFAFTYQSAHAQIMARRKEWFHMPNENHFVLWWVPVGHQPSLEEAIDRMEALRADGPSPLAFHFKQAFDPLGGPVIANPNKK